MAGGGTDHLGGTLAGAPPDGERRAGLRAIGMAVSRISAALVKRHGVGVVARLKAEWSAIVGAELAARAWPEALARDGALRLRVAPGFGLELQHRAPLVIERINVFFGRPAVMRLVLVQAPLPLAAASPAATTPMLTAAETAALDAQLGAIADPGLRAALARLGRAVVVRGRGEA